MFCLFQISAAAGASNVGAEILHLPPMPGGLVTVCNARDAHHAAHIHPHMPAEMAHSAFQTVKFRLPMAGAEKDHPSSFPFT